MPVGTVNRLRPIKLSHSNLPPGFVAVTVKPLTDQPGAMSFQIGSGQDELSVTLPTCHPNKMALALSL